MYRILILDDERKFTGTEADEIVHVEHSWDAIAELRSKDFNEVWLDYDLGGDDKGSNVCRFIRDDNEYVPGFYVDLDRPWVSTEFHIHSFNPDGRMAMKQILKDSGITAIMEDLSKFESKPKASSVN
jgi:hypothetical protein